MDISGTYTLNAPREKVWDALFDPEILKRAVPGCESIERTSADEYAMRLHVDVAGTRGSYDGSLRVLEAQKPESYRLVVDGTGARGILHGDGKLRLETNDTGATVVTYSGQAQLGGAIASIGVGVARTAAQHLIQDFFGRLQQALPGSVATTVAPATIATIAATAAPEATPVVATAPPPADAFAAPAAPADAPVDALLPRTAPIIPPPAPPSPPSAPPAEALATPPTSAAPAPAVSPVTEAPAATAATATAATAATGNGATAIPRATPPPAPSATPARRVGITDGSIEDGKRAARTIWVGIIIAIVVVAVVILYIVTR